MSKVAILLGDGYEDSEFEVPFKCLREAGHEVVVLGTQRDDTVHGKGGKSEVRIERTPDDFDPDDFDAVVVPGGHGPDKLRLDPAMVEFTRRFAASGKPLAAICHGPQLLIEANAVQNRTLTSWPSVRTDLVNAGASWVDKSVVEDDNLITSRKPDDLDDFCAALLARL